jgi:DNA topoisomerase IA
VTGDDAADPRSPCGADPQGGFINSAHPPIHPLKPDLRPEEFELVFQANRAETIVYRIIAAPKAADDTPAALLRHRLTLYRKQADGRRQVGIRFEALVPDHDGWMLDAPIFGEDLAQAVKNDPDLLALLAETATGEIQFEIEDCFGQAGKLPFSRLLHLMKAARLGRPSTYAATLKRLFGDSSVVTLDPTSGAVCLTPAGAELGARLQTRCNDLTSIEFTRTFDHKLNAVAAGSLTPQAFLTWMLTLTHPGDPLAAVAAAKLWNSVDELRADRIAAGHGLEGSGAFISHPLVEAPEALPLPP